MFYCALITLCHFLNVDFSVVLDYTEVTKRVIAILAKMSLCKMQFDTALCESVFTTGEVLMLSFHRIRTTTSRRTLRLT